MLTVALALSACVATRAPDAAGRQVAIPLIVMASGPNAQLLDIDVQIDGRPQRLLFDTGAASSGVSITAFTARYPAVSQSQSEGVSGQALSCELIQPARIVFGSHSIDRPKLTRCARDLFGIDLLRDLAFRIDMRRRELVLIQQLPMGAHRYPLERLARGHMAMPLTVGAIATRGLFDTGSDTTVVDSAFVAAHADQFIFVRADTGSDANGKNIPSGIYRCSSLRIGSLRLRGVEVAVFDFGDPLRQKMEQVPIIVGTDIISKARWNIDLALGQWSAQPYGLSSID